jgi:hypothetical protein
VVAERLRDAAEAFAADRDDRLAVILLRLRLGNGLDVVADEADRAFGLDGDALVEREQHLDLVHDRGELLGAAEYDVLFLEVGGELHRVESVDACRANITVAARGPGILTAANGAVADMDHVLDRAPDDALRAGVSAAANGHDAGDRLNVGLDAAIGLAFLERAKMLGAPFCGLLRIDFEDLLDEALVPGLDVFD